MGREEWGGEGGVRLTKVPSEVHGSQVNAWSISMAILQMFYRRDDGILQFQCSAVKVHTL